MEYIKREYSFHTYISIIYLIKLLFLGCRCQWIESVKAPTPLNHCGWGWYFLPLKGNFSCYLSDRFSSQCVVLQAVTWADV